MHANSWGFCLRVQKQMQLARAQAARRRHFRHLLLQVRSLLEPSWCTVLGQSLCRLADCEAR